MPSKERTTAIRKKSDSSPGTDVTIGINKRFTTPVDVIAIMESVKDFGTIRTNKLLG